MPNCLFKKFVFLFLIQIFFLFLLTKPSFAQQLNVPDSVKYGDTLNLSIVGLTDYFSTKKAGKINIGIKEVSGAGVSSISFDLTPDPACLKGGSRGLVMTGSCNIGAGTVSADFDTTQLAKRSGNASYNVVAEISIGGIISQIGNKTFVVVFPYEGTFNIIELNPDKANPGNEIQVTISGAETTDGHNVYAFYVIGESGENKVTCTSSKCTGTIKVPDNAQENITIEVRNWKGEKQNKMLDVISPNEGSGLLGEKDLGPAIPPPCSEWKDGKCVSIKTGFGIDVGTDVVSFTKALFSLIFSMSGGIAVILIILSGYKIILARGNPEKMQGAKESLTAAIVGLLFIIFSLVILQVIGVDILKIPGFSQ